MPLPRASLLALTLAAEVRNAARGARVVLVQRPTLGLTVRIERHEAGSSLTLVAPAGPGVPLRARPQLVMPLPADMELQALARLLQRQIVALARHVQHEPMRRRLVDALAGRVRPVGEPAANDDAALPEALAIARSLAREPVRRAAQVRLFA